MTTVYAYITFGNNLFEQGVIGTLSEAKAKPFYSIIGIFDFIVDNGNKYDNMIIYLDPTYSGYYYSRQYDNFFYGSDNVTIEPYESNDIITLIGSIETTSNQNITLNNINLIQSNTPPPQYINAVFNMASGSTINFNNCIITATIGSICYGYVDQINPTINCNVNAKNTIFNCYSFLANQGVDVFDSVNVNISNCQIEINSGINGFSIFSSVYGSINNNIITIISSQGCLYSQPVPYITNNGSTSIDNNFMTFINPTTSNTNVKITLVCGQSTTLRPISIGTNSINLVNVTSQQFTTTQPLNQAVAVNVNATKSLSKTMSQNFILNEKSSQAQNKSLFNDNNTKRLTSTTNTNKIVKNNDDILRIIKNNNDDMQIIKNNDRNILLDVRRNPLDLTIPTHLDQYDGKSINLRLSSKCKYPINIKDRMGKSICRLVKSDLYRKKDKDLFLTENDICTLTMKNNEWFLK